MDKASRREWMREWIALGLRDGLTFTDLAKRAGVSERTVRRWNLRFRDEAVQKWTPDRTEQNFVELVERADSTSGRIEIVFADERRIVVGGGTLVDALARLLTTGVPC